MTPLPRSARIVPVRYGSTRRVHRWGHLRARLGLAGAVVAALLGFPESARAAAGCSNDGVGTVTVTLDASPTTLTAPVTGLDPFDLDGSPGAGCDSGAQTVVVIGTAGDDTVTLDFDRTGQIVTGDLVAPGKAEIQLQLAGGDDTLVVRTSNHDDTVVSTATGVSLSSRFQDVSLDQVEAVWFDLRSGADTIDLSADGSYHVPTAVQPGIGADIVTGGAGSDTLVATPTGETSDAEADSFSGAGGVDAVDYSARLGNTMLDLGVAGASGEIGEADTVAADVETLVTGDGDDTVFGDASGQTIQTGDGSDTVFPLGGNDIVDVGAGGDLVDCGSDPDGADTFTGSTDAILDYTGRGAALTLNLALGTSLGQAGEGDSATGFGTVRGGMGPDVITGSSLAETLAGGPGNDTITAGPGADTVQGGTGNDTITGGTGPDTLQGEEGNDVFRQGTGADGTDTVVGGPGTDTVDYSQRTVAVTATLGGSGGAAGENDAIGADVESLSGGSGNDVLVGNAAVNVLLGGAGNDTLSGLLGADVESGGPGNDVFSQDATANGADSLSGGTGLDRADYVLRTRGVVVILDNRANDGGTGEKDNVRSDIENVRGGTAADVLSGSAPANVLEGLGGADSLDGLGGVDRLLCGAGADRAVRRVGDRYTACESVR